MNACVYLSCVETHIPELWSHPKLAGSDASSNQKTLINLYLDYFPHNLGYELHNMLAGRSRPKTLKLYIEMFCQNMHAENKKCKDLVNLYNVMCLYAKSSRAAPTASSPSILKPSPSLHNVDASPEHTGVRFAPTAAPSSDVYKKLSWTKHNGCLTVMNGHDCHKGFHCPFSHNTDTLKAMRQDYLKHLQSVDYEKNLRGEPLQRPAVSAQRDRDYKPRDIYALSTIREQELYDEEVFQEQLAAELAGSNNIPQLYA
jgi:hypothetical protein